ncbi:MAG TPA: hypothetical protein VEG38_19450 [Acidimicrobiia bacterium]|nr:hypothetical protein [Acidimicrobiia bacterium]
MTVLSLGLRRIAGFVTSGVLLGVLALSPAMPVSALEQSNNTIRVTENQTVEKEFGPIAMANPAPPVPAAVPVPQSNTPENCKQATYCDVIPLEIVLPPDFKPNDEFFVTVFLDWKTDQLPGVKVGEAEYREPEDINDLDLYVWNDPPAEAPVQQGATKVRPEQARFFRPDKGKYSIVVFNYIGPNTGYKLRVEYKKEDIVPPFELLPPEFNPVAIPPQPFEPPVELTEPEAPTLPIDTSEFAAPTDTTPPAPPVETKPSPLTPVAIDPDPDFTDFADDEFDEQLAAPSSDVLQEKQVKAVGPPEPASTTSLVFWLAIVPILLLAGGGIWLSRKGSAVLNVR